MLSGGLMEVKDINKYFSLEILRRGYDYYKKGKVKQIIKLKDGYIARVNGTEEYKVTIVLNKKSICNMECTCPYAEENNCKHMAAVLYCLKNNDIPVRENNIKVKTEEITNFEKFKREFKREYNKLFHNRSYLHENELEDYINIVNKFTEEGIKYIKSDVELAYEIFELFIMEVDYLDVCDSYGKKEEMFANLFDSFKELFENEKIFVRFLAFIGTIYTINSDECYFNHKENMLNLLYQYIQYKWQAEDVLILLRKLDNDKRVYNYEKRNIKIKRIYTTYYFIDQDKALKLAENSLDLREICEFLLDLYKNDESKQIELLEKIIYANKGYSNEQYYVRLISIYKKKDKQKYLELLNKYFIEHKDIEIYREIKSNYEKEEWNKIKKGYLDKVKDSRIYIDICIEEEYYDEMLKKLESEWIETVNKYLKLLVKHRPKEILELYKNKLITEIDRASCRQHYQHILSYFNNMLKIPQGKKELKNIILYIRQKYKNRKALQEEIDFYEETYL